MLRVQNGRICCSKNQGLCRFAIKIGGIHKSLIFMKKIKKKPLQTVLFLL